MIYITAVHMVGGTQHEHIGSVLWRHPDTGATGEISRYDLVDWIDSKRGEAYVTDGSSTVEVGVVHARPPFIRTYADGRWTDNLLALPRY